MIENYFWRKNAGDLLSLKNKQNMVKTQRRKIIILAVDYMIECYSIDVSFLQKCITAFALVTLFPSLKYKGSKDGTVSIERKKNKKTD